MDRAKRDHLALYIWDYFYLANVPRPGEARPWASIERATERIRESQIYVDPPFPADVRLRHATRVRNAARAALRGISELSAPPARWVVDGLEELAQSMAALVEELRAPARELVVD